MKKTTKQRFEEKFYVTPSCWVWTACSRTGYGLFKMGGKNMSAHRVSYDFYVGPIPDNLVVCHKCDNPICVNPDHLFVGTINDNNQDKVRKGRQTTIRNRGATKIPREIVEQIRLAHESGESNGSISTRFGVAKSHVWNLAKMRKRVDSW